MRYMLNVNGQSHAVDVDSDTPLLWVLRDDLNLKGTKFSCGTGVCGSCTVHIDGALTRSCTLPVSDVGTASITTIEGIGRTPIGARLQKAWLDIDVAQCGYCQAGQIMQAIALLKSKPKPSDREIDELMSGNICRCGTYQRIRAAIKVAAMA